MATYKEVLEKFGQGKSKVVIRIDPSEAYTFNYAFKTHRNYIKHLFAQKGLEILRYNHTYNDDGSIKECGLVYSRSDSDLNPYMEVWGIEGVSVRPTEVVDGD